MQMIEQGYERIQVGICKQLSVIGVAQVSMWFQPYPFALTKISTNDSDGCPILESL